MPPSKKPMTLSNPTLDNLVIASSTRLLSTTNKRDWWTSDITDPTQGAKPPSNPTKIEFGIWELAKSSWCLTSSTITFSSFKIAPNSSAESGLLLFSSIEERSWYPSLFNLTLAEK